MVIQSSFTVPISFSFSPPLDLETDQAENTSNSNSDSSSSSPEIEQVLGNIDTEVENDHVLSPISTIIKATDQSLPLEQLESLPNASRDLSTPNKNSEQLRESLFDKMSHQDFQIPGAKELQRAIIGGGERPVSSDVLDVQNVLRKAQDILSAYNKSRSTSPTPSNREASSRVIASSSEPTSTAEVAIDKLDTSSQRSIKPARASASNLLLQQYLSARSRTISNSSNIFDENDTRPYALGASMNELEHLREENEHLSIKLNRLRYDLKSRDSTVDDLKLKITQKYVEL